MAVLSTVVAHTYTQTLQHHQNDVLLELYSAHHWHTEATGLLQVFGQ